MKNELPRLFIAIPIDDQWKEHLTKQCSLLQTKLPFQKWTHPDDYHITLKFLGETSDSQIKQMDKLLASVAKNTRVFDLEEQEWGTFGPQSAPSILWAGIGGDLSALKKLQKKVDRMDKIGFPQEDRAFHPHLTIARRYIGTAPIKALMSQLFENHSDNIVHWPIDKIQLFQSNFQKKPMYEPIATFKLKPK